MLDCINWNQSGTPDKGDQGVNMVTEWGRKNYKRRYKKVSNGLGGNSFY
jgi:hypothetical protein